MTLLGRLAEHVPGASHASGPGCVVEGLQERRQPLLEDANVLTSARTRETGPMPAGRSGRLRLDSPKYGQDQPHTPTSNPQLSVTVEMDGCPFFSYVQYTASNDPPEKRLIECRLGENGWNPPNLKHAAKPFRVSVTPTGRIGSPVEIRSDPFPFINMAFPRTK